ncbi:hypothetical protein [Tenggerimyces flavus]|uniref:Uncharacterized protein n=1 Tax=Tenggerimyces flavus TaxID=1708749 RepID=A0ABV7YD35_9ACTN|nr:hypothetical protein [Tenggerimyces flavus]MBM7788080.1 hypothetical protein [Tenggerimyces flavus]
MSGRAVVAVRRDERKTSSSLSWESTTSRLGLIVSSGCSTLGGSIQR